VLQRQVPGTLPGYFRIARQFHGIIAYISLESIKSNYNFG